METYELHVCQNGDWRKLKTFEVRQAAMSASIELERARRFSAVKIFKLALDPEVTGNTKKLIHRWSAETSSPVGRLWVTLRHSQPCPECLFLGVEML